MQQEDLNSYSGPGYKFLLASTCVFLLFPPTVIIGAILFLVGSDGVIDSFKMIPNELLLGILGSYLCLLMFYATTKIFVDRNFKVPKRFHNFFHDDFFALAKRLFFIILLVFAGFALTNPTLLRLSFGMILAGIFGAFFIYAILKLATRRQN